MKNIISKQFHDRFGSPDIYIKSPGRANIIGEHTDYHNGLVLPFAIEQAIHLFIRSNELKKMRVYASDIDDYEEIDLQNLSYKTIGWVRYFVNSLVALNLPLLKGIDVVFGGDLPSGAGLSSSSSITCGFLAGLNALFKLNLEKNNLIQLASQAENGIGLKGGTMDQTVIVEGRENHALLIDYLNLSMKAIPLRLDEYHFYIIDSGQKHNLVESGYNDRRATSEQALEILRSQDPSITTFRDVTLKDIHHHLKNEEEVKRCKHVVTENDRVLQSVHALQNQDFDKLGQLLNASHYSLSNDYQVSTPEIDFLVQQSLSIPCVLGSRIMGGGFGGSTINLVHRELLPDQIQTQEKLQGIKRNVLMCK